MAPSAGPSRSPATSAPTCRSSLFPCRRARARGRRRRVRKRREAAAAAMRDLEGCRRRRSLMLPTSFIRLAKAQRHNQPEEIQRLLGEAQLNDSRRRCGNARRMRNGPSPASARPLPEMRRLPRSKRAPTGRAGARGIVDRDDAQHFEIVREIGGAQRAAVRSAPSRRGGGRPRIAGSLCRATPPSKPPTSSARSNRRCSRSLRGSSTCYAASHHAGGNATPRRRRLPRAVGRRVPRRRRGGGGRH